VSLIVSDTTPISCLLRIGRPDLLATLFPDLRIPTEVAAEFDRGAEVIGDWRAMLPHIQIETVQAMPLLDLLKEEVDAGEAAALALGVSLHADLVLMDEVHGRAIAHRLGLTVTGTLGLVVRAKRSGLIPAARRLLLKSEPSAGSGSPTNSWPRCWRDWVNSPRAAPSSASSPTLSTRPPSGRQYKPPGRSFEASGRSFEASGRSFEASGRSFEASGRRLCLESATCLNSSLAALKAVTLAGVADPRRGPAAR